MSVFSRMYDILKSNISDRFGRDEQDDFDLYDFLKQERQPNAPRNGRKQQNRDPELAKFYANLETPYGSDLATVRKSYKRLMRKYHPDLHSKDPRKTQIANEIVQGLNQAYSELEKRLAN